VASKGFKRPVRWYISVFLAPATIVYTVFAIYPIVESLRLSLYAKETGGGTFVGLANYARLFGEPYWAERFANAFWNNVVLFAIHMAIQNPIALALAALLSLPTLTGAATYRTIFFLPTLLSVRCRDATPSARRPRPPIEGRTCGRHGPTGDGIPSPSHVSRDPFRRRSGSSGYHCRFTTSRLPARSPHGPRRTAPTISARRTSHVPRPVPPSRRAGTSRRRPASRRQPRAAVRLR